MPTGARNALELKNERPPALFIERLVVLLVLISLSATTYAVFLFLKQAKAKPVASQVVGQPEPVIEQMVAPTVVKNPEAKPAVKSQPDQSAGELAAIEAQIKKVREDQAKADLMAWAAEAAARLLKNRETALLQQGDKAAKSVAKLRAGKETLEKRASDLADSVARLELARDDAKAKLEAAKNRKGFSIMPYRGPNGTWQRPLPIECANETAQIMPGGPSFRLIDLELSGLSRTSLFSRIVELAMRKAASQATPDGNAPTVYVLFVVRPSGIKSYYEARARLQAQGVAFGYELVDEKTPIDYPDLGDLSEWPGYVPPQELAGLAPDGSPGIEPGGTGRKSGNGSVGSVGNSVAGKEDDGLYVWKNGLDGTRPPGTGGGGLADSPTSGLGRSAGGSPWLSPGNVGELAGTGNGTGAITGRSGNGSGANSTGGGALGANAARGDGSGRGAGNAGSPRVDFGPGTLSQLGRGRGGTGLSGRAASVSDGSGSGDGAGKINLEPPYGKTVDPRRSGLNGSSGSGFGGGAGGGSGGQAGTFDGLMAELARESGEAGTGNSLSAGRLASRPGAVPIMPGDLADNPSGNGLGGAGTLGELPGGGGSENTATAANGSQSSRGVAPGTGRSPFSGGVAAALPKFESVGADGTASDAGQSGAASPTGGNQGGAAGSTPSGTAASAGVTNAGASSGANAGSQRGVSGASVGSAGGSAAGSGSRVGLSGGQPGGGSQSDSDNSSSDDKPEKERGLGASLRRMFNADKNLPEKSWEVVLYCDADGVTIRPGEHRLNLKDLQSDPDLLPRTLLSIHEKHARQNPDRYWRPYIHYRVAGGGDAQMGLAQQQLANGFVRWPAVWERVAANTATNDSGRRQ